MSGFKRLLRLPNPDVRRDVDDELQSHIEMKAAELVEAGMDAEAARGEAHRRFGNLRSIRRRCNGIQSQHARNTASGEFVDSLWQDVRIGTRTLRKNPGFTVVAVLTLAFAIGANTAMFTVVDAVLLRPLPFEDPDRLVVVRETWLPEHPVFWVSAGNVTEWQQRNSLFELIGVHRLGGEAGSGLEGNDLVLSGPDEPVAIPTIRVSANLFTLLGVEPLHGRTFRPEEDQPGNDAVVILSHGFWRRHFGADPDLIGRQMLLSDRGYTVVGVMPPDFEFPLPVKKEREGASVPTTDVWIPLALSPQARQDRGQRLMPYATGRLKPGVTIEQVRQELETIAAQLATEYPESNEESGIRVESVLDFVVGEVRPALLLLMGAVGLVLLIASTNVAAMLLSRGIERQREMALRRALGAGRRRLIRQLLTEGLILGVAGTAMGLVAAHWGIQLLLAFAPEELPRIQQVAMNGDALGYALAVTLLSVMICSLFPAVRASSLGSVEALKATAGTRSGGERPAAVMRRRVRPHGVLVMVQMALSLLLLVGAGLLIRSFALLQQVDPGFEASNLLVAHPILPRARYPRRIDRTRFAEQLIAETAALPGVLSVAGASPLPFAGVKGSNCCNPIEGVAAGQPTETGDYSGFLVTVDYFRTMGIPLLRGRAFTAEERREEWVGEWWKDGSLTAIISESMAERDFPGDDPIGKWIGTAKVVGIVGDVRQERLDSDEEAASLYLPFLQWAYAFPDLVIRTATKPATLIPAVRSVVSTLDADVPITFVTMEQAMGNSLARQRFAMLLMAVLGALALALVASGIYGVASYSVARRTHEFGIRRALGAKASTVFHLVLREGLCLSLAGLAIGLVAALWLTRLIASQLYGVAATDPVTFVAVGVGLVVVALIASYVPARRATRVDPMMALRAE
jgi:putative ABC transport system permease protein